MKKIVILSVAILLMNSVGLLALSSKKAAKSQKEYTKGLKHYLQRDFQKAAESWQKALEYDLDNEKAKSYFDKAQDKYYNSLKLYYTGVSLFKDKKYDEASEKFKESLLINPLNEKVKYYVKLCVAPVVKVELTNNLFTLKNNVFKISVDKSDTVNNWEKSWSFRIEDEKGKVVRLWKGDGSPSQIEWDGKDESGNPIILEGKMLRQATIVSFFDREISNEKEEFKVDTKGPELEISSESNFSPDDLSSKGNKIHFLVKASDGGTGVGSIRIEVYNTEKDKKLKTIEKSNQNMLKYEWDGTFDDGGKMVGGSTVFYKVVAVDKAGNETISDWRKIDSKIVLKQEKKGLVMNLPNIEFDSGKARLKKKSYSILMKAGEILNRYGDAKFIIEGHTDNVGSDAANLKLSEKRAETVYKFLSKKFKISKDRVQVKGYGESKPIAPNDTAMGRAKNRRVEIVIVSK